MIIFNGQEYTPEPRFIHDLKTEFNIISRRNWLLGLWAAEKMGMQGEHAQLYAGNIMKQTVEEPNETIDVKLAQDLKSVGIDISVQEVSDEMHRLHDIVSRQILR